MSARPYQVRPLEPLGATRHFATLASAKQFAQRQVDASWSNDYWSIRDIDTEQRHKVYRTVACDDVHTVKPDAFQETVSQITDALTSHGVEIEFAIKRATDFVTSLIAEALAEQSKQLVAV